MIDSQAVVKVNDLIKSNQSDDQAAGMFGVNLDAQTEKQYSEHSRNPVSPPAARQGDDQEAPMSAKVSCAAFSHNPDGQEAATQPSSKHFVLLSSADHRGHQQMKLLEDCRYNLALLTARNVTRPMDALQMPVIHGSKHKGSAGKAQKGEHQAVSNSMVNFDEVKSQQRTAAHTLSGQFIPKIQSGVSMPMTAAALSGLASGATSSSGSSKLQIRDRKRLINIMDRIKDEDEPRHIAIQGHNR
jgi:hypothetical protein